MSFLETVSRNSVVLDTSPSAQDDVIENVRKIRKYTYAPMLVISAQDDAVPIMEVGADVCIPPDDTVPLLLTQAMALIRRNERYNSANYLKQVRPRERA